MARGLLCPLTMTMATIDLDQLATVVGGADQDRVRALARFLNLSPDAINKIGLEKAEQATRAMLSAQLGRP
jgi:hypothetical protein